MSLEQYNIKNSIIGKRVKSESHVNRFLCPNCNFITSRKDLPLSPIICPICGKILTRITIYSN